MNKNLKTDSKYEFNDDEKNKYNNLINKLDLFMIIFLMEREDNRELKNPSERYKRIEQELNKLVDLPQTNQNTQIIGTLGKELDVLRLIELNEKQPFDSFDKKIDERMVLK